jgi:hypothetical protein
MKLTLYVKLFLSVPVGSANRGESIKQSELLSQISECQPQLLVEDFGVTTFRLIKDSKGGQIP